MYIIPIIKDYPSTLIKSKKKNVEKIKEHTNKSLENSSPNLLKKNDHPNHQLTTFSFKKLVYLVYLFLFVEILECIKNMATTLLLKTNNISTSGGYNINKIHWVEYEQHLIGYAIIRRISKILKKSLQHIFINNNPRILVQIHTFTLN